MRIVENSPLLNERSVSDLTFIREAMVEKM